MAANDREAAGVSLKLIWAGPWNVRSAVGHFGTEIVRELVTLGHQVEVLRTEVGTDLLLPARPAPGPVHVAGLQPLAKLLHDVDGVIVNLGNHYGFHGGAVPILREMAPLVILHDAWMGDFIAGWRHATGDDAWRVDRFLRRIADDASSIVAVCSMASGAVVHGPHYRKAAEVGCPGSVTSLPLAYTADDLPAARPIGDRLVVTTIGHMNRNKRAGEVIRALGASQRLRDHVSYILVGPVEAKEQASLLALARQVGAREPQFTGWVSEEVLRMLIAGTDVMCCLRYPALEGGSASMITAMLSGRPTLVSDHASYAEVPDDLVMKCAPGHEAADVTRHLETIFDDPSGARAMGERARAGSTYLCPSDLCSTIASGAGCGDLGGACHPDGAHDWTAAGRTRNEAGRSSR